MYRSASRSVYLPAWVGVPGEAVTRKEAKEYYIANAGFEMVATLHGRSKEGVEELKKHPAFQV